jgi:hypothetical protein
MGATFPNPDTPTTEHEFPCAAHAGHNFSGFPLLTWHAPFRLNIAPCARPWESTDRRQGCRHRYF